MKRTIRKMTKTSRGKEEIKITRRSSGVTVVAVEAEKAERTSSSSAGTTKMPTILQSTMRKRKSHGSSASSRLKIPQVQRPQQMTRKAMDVAVATVDHGMTTMVARTVPSTTVVTSESTMKTRALWMVSSSAEAVAGVVDATEAATVTTKMAVDEAAEVVAVTVDTMMVNTNISPTAMQKARGVAEAADVAVAVITIRAKTEANNIGVAAAAIARGIISKTVGRKVVQLPTDIPNSALEEENAKAT